MNPIATLLFALFAALGGLLPALAQTHAGHGSMNAAKQASGIDGEVRKIDLGGGKITIRHGEIKAMDMPPMTMVFTAKDKVLLEKVRVGDRIRFSMADENGRMVVTELEVAK